MKRYQGIKKFLAVLTALIIMTAVAVTAYADIGDSVSAALTEATGTLVKVVNPIAVFSVIGCGIYCILGSDPVNIKKAKTWGIGIFVGLILINAASPIVNWVQEITIE